LEDFDGLLAHDDQAIGESGDFLHDLALVRCRLSKYGVQRGYEGHPQATQQLQDMPAGAAAKDSVFVLEADQIDIAEIKEVRRLPVGSKIVLGEFESHSVG